MRCGGESEGVVEGGKKHTLKNDMDTCAHTIPKKGVVCREEGMKGRSRRTNLEQRKGKGGGEMHNENGEIMSEWGEECKKKEWEEGKE